MAKKANGAAIPKSEAEEAATATAASPDVTAALDPEVAAKIVAVRSQIRETFGKVAMTMMLLPRYRSQTLSDLQHLVLEPLLRDRIAIAYPGGDAAGPLADMVGLAIWASVNDEADKRIREQIQAGTFPIRLKAEDWDSGTNNWLLDIVATDARAAAQVIANFKSVVKGGGVRLHPIITRLVDTETLEKIGAKKMATQ